MGIKTLCKTKQINTLNTKLKSQQWTEIDIFGKSVPNVDNPFAKESSPYNVDSQTAQVGKSSYQQALSHESTSPQWLICRINLNDKIIINKVPVHATV